MDRAAVAADAFTEVVVEGGSIAHGGGESEGVGRGYEEGESEEASEGEGEQEIEDEGKQVTDGVEDERLARLWELAEGVG